MNSNNFFKRANKKGFAYTFDDVTLQDIPSNVLPTVADLSCRVTKNYTLRVPLISAAMDTTTEAEMAVTMAKNGGMGVIHRNMSVKEQALQVEWVRRQVHYGGMISNPVTFNDNDTIADLQASVEKNGWNFSSFPIINKNKILVGMITKKELSFANGNPKLKEIMKPLSKIRVVQEIDVANAYKIMVDYKIKKVPVVSDLGTLVGLYVWSDVRKDEETKNKFSLDKQGRLLVAAAVGPGENERERIDQLIEAECPIIVVDCSHGACNSVVEQVNYIKNHKGVDVIAGNIASFESAEYILANSEPDALKVGIGPGSICTTRRVTGHGIPQLSAVYQVRQACAGLPVIADGGITCSGDIVKAIAVGADCIMMGSVLAGTNESPGNIITQNGKKYKSYRGMGSRAAMSECSGSRSRYFKQDQDNELLTMQQQNKITPEGVEALVEYKGSVVSVIEELCGGIQSGLAHSNANNFHELKKNAKFWLQTSSGYIEGKPHNIINF